MADIADKGHYQQEIELEMRISDKESNELSKLEEQLQGAYKQIDEIQNRIDEKHQKLGIDKIFIDEKDTSDEATDMDTRPQHIPGETNSFFTPLMLGRSSI